MADDRRSRRSTPSGPRAEAWLAANMPRVGEARDAGGRRRRRDRRGDRARMLQRMLYDGGFAGICFPAEYGGQGLTARAPAGVHRGVAATRCRSCSTSDASRSWPPRCSTTAPRSRSSAHIPAILRGRRAVGPVPLRAVAAAPTWPGASPGPRVTATSSCSTGRRSGAPAPSRADYAHVPGPHRLGRAEAPRADHVHRQDPPARRSSSTRSSRSNGSREFCQEFFDDVAHPGDSVVGRVNDGWTVATPLLATRRTRWRRLAVCQRGHRARRAHEPAERPPRAGPVDGHVGRRPHPRAARRGHRPAGAAAARHRRRLRAHRARRAADPGDGDPQAVRRHDPGPGDGHRRRAGRAGRGQRVRRPGRRDVHQPPGPLPRLAAATRSSATSSASACSGCRGSRPPTAAWRSRTSAPAGADVVAVPTFFDFEPTLPVLWARAVERHADDDLAITEDGRHLTYAEFDAGVATPGRRAARPRRRQGQPGGDPAAAGAGVDRRLPRHRSHRGRRRHREHVRQAL